MVDVKKPLYRLPRQGQIFGVCAGLADFFGIDITLMRVIFVIAAFATGGAVVVLYIILAIILPVPNENGKQHNLSAASESFGERVQRLGQEARGNKVVGYARNYLGIGLLIIGVWLLLGQIFPRWFELQWDFVWPILLILVGLFIIARRGNG
jgi:phage shock protein PspC (stress-responsive transcriptional regulator)